MLDILRMVIFLGPRDEEKSQREMERHRIQHDQRIPIERTTSIPMFLSTGRVSLSADVEETLFSSMPIRADLSRL